MGSRPTPANQAGRVVALASGHALALPLEPFTIGGCSLAYWQCRQDMFALAYVLLAPDFTSLQGELDRALAPFKRGGVGDFPKEKLAFDDLTSELERMHAGGLFVTMSRGRGMRFEGDSAMSSDLLDQNKLGSSLSDRSMMGRRVSLRDLKPSFERFVESFSRHPRDQETKRVGTWLNPLGRWDWWDLGGSFDGFIVDGHRHPSGQRLITSGPAPGRDILASLRRALGSEPNDDEAQIEGNVEPASALLAAARVGDARAWPTAVVLPEGACADETRWFDNLGWRDLSPELFAVLRLPNGADHHALCRAAYEMFEGHVAAAIAYHL